MYRMEESLYKESPLFLLQPRKSASLEPRSIFLNLPLPLPSIRSSSILLPGAPSCASQKTSIPLTPTPSTVNPPLLSSNEPVSTSPPTNQVELELQQLREKYHALETQFLAITTSSLPSPPPNIAKVEHYGESQRKPLSHGCPWSQPIEKEEKEEKETQTKEKVSLFNSSFCSSSLLYASCAIQTDPIVPDVHHIEIQTDGFNDDAMSSKSKESTSDFSDDELYSRTSSRTDIQDILFKLKEFKKKSQGELKSNSVTPIPLQTPTSLPFLKVFKSPELSPPSPTPYSNSLSSRFPLPTTPFSTSLSTMGVEQKLKAHAAWLKTFLEVLEHTHLNSKF